MFLPERAVTFKKLTEEGKSNSFTDNPCSDLELGQSNAEV